jgi:hypothetical protein
VRAWLRRVWRNRPRPLRELLDAIDDYGMWNE